MNPFRLSLRKSPDTWVNLMKLQIESFLFGNQEYQFVCSGKQKLDRFFCLVFAPYLGTDAW